MSWKDIYFYGVIGILSPILLMIFAYYMVSLKMEIRRMRKLVS